MVNNILIIKLLTKYTGEDYKCDIHLFDLSNNYIGISYTVNPVPFSSSDGYVYIVIPEQSSEKTMLPPQEIKFNLLIYPIGGGSFVFSILTYTSGNLVKPEYNHDSTTIKPVIPTTSPNPLKPICLGQLTINNNNDGCCYKDGITLESCSRGSKRGGIKCVSKTDKPYDNSINCCNTETNVWYDNYTFDVICEQNP